MHTAIAVSPITLFIQAIGEHPPLTGHLCGGDLAKALYAAHWVQRLQPPPQGASPGQVAAWQETTAQIERLRGHDVACRCKPDNECHGDWLLQRANR